jgi:uncharacterized protein YcfJ
MSQPAVFALVDNETHARTAVAELEAVGFLASDISVLSQSSGTSQIESADVVGDPTLNTPLTGTSDVGHTNSTKAPEGATTGGLTGGTVGAIAGWMIGIGALAIPGVGPFIAAGPILAALSGAALGAAAGGLTGGLIGYGIPEYEAKLYSGRLAQGNFLIGVHALDSKQADAAVKAFEMVKAHDIKKTSEVVAK